MNRPHAFIMKEIEIKFPKAPLSHKPLKMVIPNLVFPIPLMSGHTCYLTLPANYNKYDLKILQETLTLHLEIRKEAQEAFKTSVLGEYISRVVKKKTILQTHF